jgi:hypothetical protein
MDNLVEKPRTAEGRKFDATTEEEANDFVTWTNGRMYLIGAGDGEDVWSVQDIAFWQVYSSDAELWFVKPLQGGALLGPFTEAEYNAQWEKVALP